jgi:hypothetical protein
LLNRRLLLVVAVFLLSLPASAVTIDNDDSCDIAVMPAATLLIPWFEVDTESPGATTHFTVTNVTNVERIAHVTLWTDRAYPVIGFNLFLTGYDAQSIDLYDVITRGLIAPDNGTGTAVSPRGRYSDPNAALDLSGCRRLPGPLPDEYVVRMKEAFTAGRVPAVGGAPACDQVGGEHARAVGYVTIDVVGTCTANTPEHSEYWTQDIRYDNVLIGDYRFVDPTADVAQGGPMVHIRAVPEGGTPESRRAAPVAFDAGFDRTFYARHQPADAPRLDGRQPLPSQFAARWIQGGPAEFRTSLKVWREGRTRSEAPCSGFEENADIDAVDIIRFDESENAVGRVPPQNRPNVPVALSLLGAASKTSVGDDGVFPQLTNGATAGWMYLNLDADSQDGFAAQSWVVSSMQALGTLSSESDAAALGNGCSAAARASEVSAPGGGQIAPSPNRSVRSGRASTNNDDSCDIAVLPAATLLVPFFHVDVEPTRAQNTLLSITNVSPSEQIARVTLWTDYAFPVITFNVYLTGYDVQSIDLYDVIARGVIAPDQGTGMEVSNRGPWSRASATLERGGCERLPGVLAPEWTSWMRNAFQLGEVPDFGTRESCGEVGGVHSYASGYATIDVVRNCALTPPTEPRYWTRDIAYDNVLIGDYQQVSLTWGSAQGSPMVHIRAIPEGGTSAERRENPARPDAGFPRTFYSRLQSASTPRLDARQPLPSTFAAQWSSTFTDVHTILEIWREGATSGQAVCGQHDNNGFMPLLDIVKFDENENAVAGLPPVVTLPIDIRVSLPAASWTNILDSSIYPFLTNGATSGWLYFNLDRVENDAVASQAWVAVTRATLGRSAVRLDAAALGNGCSPPVTKSEVDKGTAVIGPSGNNNR